jgi:hypothetical protein
VPHTGSGFGCLAARSGSGRRGNDGSGHGRGSHAHRPAGPGGAGRPAPAGPQGGPRAAHMARYPPLPGRPQFLHTLGGGWLPGCRATHLKLRLALSCQSQTNAESSARYVTSGSLEAVIFGFGGLCSYAEDLDTEYIIGRLFQ